MLKPTKFLLATLSFLLLSSNVAMAETNETKVTYNKKEVEDFFNKNNFSENQEKNLREKIANNGVASGKCGFTTLRAFSPLISRVYSLL